MCPLHSFDGIALNRGAEKKKLNKKHTITLNRINNHDVTWKK